MPSQRAPSRHHGLAVGVPGVLEADLLRDARIDELELHRHRGAGDPIIVELDRAGAARVRG
ncbi:MAG: hypothetical protein HY060_09245 [Proteobacteria bacterium]|nr:hypothetical protein [Pseudomonadota bacterium]